MSSTNGNGNGKGAAPGLNLDALYGVSEPITIQWEGRKYTLLRPDALGPRAIVRLEALRESTGELKAAGTNITEAASEEIERVTVETLAILCPDLNAAGMSFALRMHTLGWYFEQVQSADTLEKKVKPKRRRTGAIRSPRSRSGTS